MAGIFTTGINNAGEYMASGWPFAAEVAAGDVVYFPWVTNEVYITNIDAENAYVGFTNDGILAANRIFIPVSQSLTLRVKISELHTIGTGSLTVGAALTNILPMQYPTLVSSSFVVNDPDNMTLTKEYPGV